MAKYSIEDTTLIALGDAVRNKTGEFTRMETVYEEVEIPEMIVSKTPNATGFETHEGNLPSASFFDVVRLPGASKIKVKIGWQVYASFYYVTIAQGEANTKEEFNLLPMQSKYKGDSNMSMFYQETVFDGDVITFYYLSGGLSQNCLGYYAECIALDADGNEIGGTTVLVEKEVEVKNTMTPMQMAEAINSLEIASGDIAIEDLFVIGEGEVAEYTNDRATKLREYGFYGLTFGTLNLPNVTELDARCFAYTTITNLNIPKVTVIPQYVFQNCNHIDTSFFNQITEVEDNGFNGCSPMSLKGVGIEFPNLTTIGYQGFYSTNFGSIKLPKLTTLVMNSSSRSQAFGYNYNITKADFGPGLKNLPQRTFYGSTKFETLILRSETMVTLGGSATSNVFSSTSIQRGEGYVYVPAALIEEYKAAQYWSEIAAQFRAIEDYPDICG